jgi:hypothetical protein
MPNDFTVSVRRNIHAETFSDVHAAFVEFRAKETDKVSLPTGCQTTLLAMRPLTQPPLQCLSAQCIYCQSVRAKNTSRQRSHLLDCQPYLNAMKEHNPQNPLLELAASHAANGSPATPSAPSVSKLPTGSHQKSNKRPRPTTDPDDLVMVSATGFQGDSTFGRGGFPVPKPTLERDFQMCVQLNPKIGVGQGIWGERNWVSFISGHWNGRWGKGSVLPGGQDKQLIAQDLSTHSEANYLLQTHDQPAAYITVRTEGWRVGPREVLAKLTAVSASPEEVDPKTYSYRLYIHMETGDHRYLHLNTGMWIGSAMRRGTEVIYDAYRVL